MKKSLWKNNFKEIIKTRRRFISILIMAFLGVGFFSGLIATGPDMRDSLDKYANSNNLYDIEIVSTLGLTDEDIETINKIDEIENSYGSKTKDTLAKIDSKESICKVIEYNNNVNTPAIIEGRLPENTKECLLDKNYSLENNPSEYIGQTVILENEELNSNNEPIFNQKEFTIVGIAESPIYISSERGNTTIGKGSIDFFIYTNTEVINLNYYTNIYSKVKGVKELNSYSEKYWNLVTPAVEKIEKIKAEREEARYNNLVNEAREKLANIPTENLQAEINKIEKATWYIRDRKDNIGYTNIIDAIKTMTNIAKLFPIIFYLVAVLISLTSMTRMIEEERTEIGTLKALGYTNNQIILKYILYSFLACVIGGFIGMSVGFTIIPNIVWKIYSSIYEIPKFYTEYRLDIGLVGLIISFICIGGATILVAIKELKNMPSILMRPKAPKNGKKILLEKITFIWKKFNFSNKVTARNIFRYKKRAIMTIVGIAGCTGLMVTGFGIKDSVKDIPESQFGDIFTYNMSVSLSDSTHLEEIEEIARNHMNIENYTKICASAGKLKGIDLNYETNIFAIESIEDFEKVCNLKDYNTKEKIELTDDGIILSDKASELLNIKQGDNIILIDSDNIEHSFKVIHIAENYVSNYVYMTKNFYEENIKNYNINMLLLNTKNLTESTQIQLTETFLKIDGVASAVMMSDAIKAIDDMLNSLNYVVIILIVASALLAFVVLYNLANINIGERQREIATLKVLGFYDKEVDNYINKENTIFTVVGILIGLLFGYFLTDMIIASVEIDKLKFMRNILPISYVYATIISATFSFIVNCIIHFVLKKIDMIESLKSIE